MLVSDEERAKAEGRINWTRRHMPVLIAAQEEFTLQRPFEGLTIGFRIHLEPKTAVLIETLLAGGAHIVAMGNEGTTQFGTVDVLTEWGCEVLERPDDDDAAIRRNLTRISATRPDLILDNGAELIIACIERGTVPRGATEETTSGAFSLREDHAGEVGFPVIVINDSPLKAIIENKHAVGESVVDTIVQRTNVTLHKKSVVVFGYGWCGRGIALYARGRGADVTVVEPDSVKGLEAAWDGFDVRGAEDACTTADVVVTATGRSSVVTRELIDVMPDGVLLANAGHVKTEIDIESLTRSIEPVAVAPSLERYELPNGGSAFVIAKGKMVNLAAAGSIGNSIESMDLGFALQARSLAALIDDRLDLDVGPQPVPDEINTRVATAMLRSMGQL